MTLAEECFEQLSEMLDLQAKYDERCFEINGIEDEYEGLPLNKALLDEIGELNHALKPEWCWWGRGGKEADREHVLEEWVDCVHFILAKYLASSWRYATCFLKAFEDRLNDCYIPTLNGEISRDCLMEFEELASLVTTTGDTPHMAALMLLHTTLKLGFTWGEVYEAYKAKNKVNHERLDLIEQQKECE